MSDHPPTTRRDPRYSVRPGVGFVEFEINDSGDNCRRADLTSVSAAGLTFEMDSDPGIKEGTLLQAATVLIGECEVEGDLAVRYIRRVNKSRIETGCVFYPSTHPGAEKWSAVVAGIYAACAD